MTRLPLVLSLLCLVPSGAAAALAAATEPPPQVLSPDEQAQQLVDQADAAYRQGLYAQAVRLFKDAHALRAEPTILYNIARAYEKMDRKEQALEYYRRYLVAEGLDAKLRARAEEKVRLLGSAAPAPAAAVAVRHPGPPPFYRRPGGALIIAGAVVAGLGLAGLAAGAGLFTVSDQRFGDFKGTQDEFAKRDARNTAQAYSTGSVVGYAVGGALLCGGAALLGVGLKRARDAGSLRAALAPVPQGAALTIRGAF